MGFRFRKSFKVLPGVRLNVSKSGTSVSVGGKGATTNFSKKGTRSTLGVPGTGVSYSFKHGSNQGSNRTSGLGWIVLIFALVGLFALILR